MGIMPKHLAFALCFVNYSLLFSITHLISKPGIAVESEADHLFITLIEQDIQTKTPMVNITIDKIAKEAELDKKDDQNDKEERNKKDKKKVSTISSRSYKLLLIHNHHIPPRNYQYMG
jgi:hypothetical protein